MEGGGEVGCLNDSLHGIIMTNLLQVIINCIIVNYHPVDPLRQRLSKPMYIELIHCHLQQQHQRAELVRL